MKTVSVINHKGGVGKTTLAGCLAQALALSEYRVLALDNDSQHNLSTLMGLTPKSPGIRDVYRAKRKESAGTLLKSIRKTEIANLHMITAEPSLCAADIENPMVLKNAVADAGLEPGEVSHERTGLIVGTGGPSTEAIVAAAMPRMKYSSLPSFGNLRWTE